MKSNPYPTVEFEGYIYKLRSRNSIIPDLDHMSHFEALIWICRNTWPRGYQKVPNPLIGLGGAIEISSK